MSWSAKFTSFLLESFTHFSRKQLQTGRQHAYLWQKKYPILQRVGTIFVGVLSSSAVSLAAFRPMLAFTKPSKPEQVIDPIQVIVERADALYDQVKYEEMYMLLMQYKYSDTNQKILVDMINSCVTIDVGLQHGPQFKTGTNALLMLAQEISASIRLTRFQKFLNSKRKCTEFQDENNDEILWRLARATFEKSKLQASKDEKVQLLKQAKEYVYKALSINETNFAAHKWASILVVELAEHEGNKAKILQSIVSKEHMLRAHALNPKDGTTLYLLGVWCFTFADLSWHQRKLAGVIFATPPSSSYEEALTYFKKAEEVEPNFYSMNLLMLGKSYLKINNKEMARKYLTMASDYPQKTDEDKQARLEAAQLLKNLN